MRLRIGIAVVVVLVLVAAGIGLTLITKLRHTQGRVYCQNNLRELSFFAKVPDPKDKDLLPTFPLSTPSGTIFKPEFPVEERLSWIVLTLPSLNQNRQNTVAFLEQINPNQRWNSENNIPFAKQPIYTLECPANPYVFDPNGLATTQYVGTGGIGNDAPTLNLGPPPRFNVDPRAGAFRYDQATPFEAITDGLSTTFLYGELAQNRGTWLQGGPTTIRPLNIDEDASVPIGTGGQFGGNHVSGAYFAYCDYSVRFMTDTADIRVLHNLMTMAGGENDPSLGE